jgi:hypothetical protein
MRSGHNPVMPIDLALGAGGALILVGLGLEWSGGESGYGSFSILKGILLLVAVAALFEPVALFLTRKTDVPVVWQALLLLVVSPLALVMGGKAVLPPDGGFGTGFFLALVGTLVAAIGVWVTVSREK